MTKSTTTAVVEKPDKPYDDFPLMSHRNGYWCKKVRGKLRYFGKWADDWQGERALNLWLDQKDELLAGREPRPADDGTLNLKDLGDLFLSAKKQLMLAGELSDRSFYDYRQTAQRVADFFGKGRKVASLRPADFTALRAKLAEDRGAIALGNEIQRVRSVFKYAVEADLIERPVKLRRDEQRSRRDRPTANSATPAARFLVDPRVRPRAAGADRSYRGIGILRRGRRRRRGAGGFSVAFSASITLAPLSRTSSRISSASSSLSSFPAVCPLHGSLLSNV